MALTTPEGIPSRRNIIDTILIVMNVSVLIVAALALFRPGGYARRWFTEWQAERRTLKALHSSWNTIARGSTLYGTGTVRVVEFSDYQCPFCRANQDAIDLALGGASGMTVGLRHLPLPMHAHAKAAALAAICSEQIGAFPAMHAYLMGTKEWEAGPRWGAIAAEVGVADTSSFLSCMAGSDAAARLQDDMSLAESLGISATPTFVTASSVTSGLLSQDILKGLLADER